jgi:hypothetical protein
MSGMTRLKSGYRNSPLPGLHFATPVWGAEYSRLFLDTVLPSFLAPGNLPSVPGRERCIYRILSLPADVARVRAHPSYTSLQDLVRVELIDLSASFEEVRANNDHSTKYDLMTRAYNEALRRADAANAASVFLNADMMLSDGSLANMVSIFLSGKRAIEIEGFRTNKDVMESALHARWKAGRAIAIPARDLVKLSLENMHKISRKHFWNKSVSSRFIPFHTYWHVGHGGILSRASHLYPLLVFPDKKFANVSSTIDQNLVELALSDPSATCIVTNSDLIYSCELSDPEYDVDGAPFDPFSVKRFSTMHAFLHDWQCTERHRATLRTPIFLHHDGAFGLTWQFAKWSTAVWAEAVSTKGLPHSIYLMAEEISQIGILRFLAEATSCTGIVRIPSQIVRALRRIVRALRRFGWRALPAMMVFALTWPFVGRSDAERIARKLLRS